MLLNRPARGAARAWRRTRPFWAGLLLLLAGAELLLVPLAPWRVLFGLGLGGVAALGIGTALITAGLFLWFLPHLRQYVGIHAVILSVVSFAVTNLGGFLVGMLLGIAGGAMGFAWTPRTPTGPGERAAPPDRGPGPAPPPALAAVLPAVLLAALAFPEPLPARVQAAAPRPATVSTTRFAPKGFTFSAVERVPTAAGPLKVIVLRMREASLSDYRLRTRDSGGAGGAGQMVLAADNLRLRGDVTLYLTRFHGCVQGLLCLTFDPDTLPAPPVVPPFVFMTDVDAEQALVTGDTLDADRLRISGDASPGAGGSSL
ncbi:DUF6114 domain-containing protein [Streptomyces sp. NPDC049577]|uniref:DUF6114 domain-containing protein n=1 Tax=Streptomyces sp. NPDC049577 TaxID=3155153 RepID=UPI00342ECA99